MSTPVTPASATVPGPTPPATAATGGPLVSRHGLQRLATGLLIYGIIGLIVGLIGLGGLIWINGKVDTAAERATTTLSQVTASLDKTATALNDASSTADSFATTIDRSGAALDQAASTVANVEPLLQRLDGQLRSVNILGAQPLRGAADVVAQIGTDIAGLDQKLGDVSTALTDNQDKLTTNADSLAALGTQLATLSARLESGVIQESLGALQAILTVLLATFVMWAVVPAIGALALGLWLRRELRASAPAVAP